jgi:transposase
MEKTHEDGLPKSGSLLLKIAARKRGFSLVDQEVRVTLVNRTSSRSRSPVRIIRSNAIRIKRLRELKETLRTNRDRLLVGIDIAKVRHVAQVRLAHTKLLDKQVTIPNTAAGFAAFWAHLQRRQRETGVVEIVCAVEPTGTYHQALATCLEGHGVDVVLVTNHVAHHNRRTLDGTWGKTNPKDAHHLGDFLERGHVLCYSLPEARTATLRRLVRLFRQARVELGACKARFRNTLLPALGPAGAPLPAAVAAALQAPLQVLLPAAQRRALPASMAALPAALAFECTDLAARLVSVPARIARIEAELVNGAAPLPASRLLLPIPGIGPTLAAILPAELGDIAWYSQVSQLRKLAGLDILRVASGQWAGTARVSKCGRPLLRGALYQAVLGACRTPGWRARREAMITKRKGDRDAFFKATVEVAAKRLRLVWGVWRSGRPFDPMRVGAPVAEPPGPATGPAIAPTRARAGRRGAPPSGQGQREIAQPSGRQAGRFSARRALHPNSEPSRRA